MPRCNSCHKWAALDLQDAEVEDVEYSDGHVSFRVAIENNCAQCNLGLTRAEFEFDEEVEFAHECPLAKQVDADGEEEHEVPEFEPEVEVNRYEKEVPPKGKVRKKFYGVTCDIKAVCSCGYETPVVTVNDEIQASSMDDIQ